MNVNFRHAALVALVAVAGSPSGFAQTSKHFGSQEVDLSGKGVVIVPGTCAGSSTSFELEARGRYMLDQAEAMLKLQQARELAIENEIRLKQQRIERRNVRKEAEMKRHADLRRRIAERRTLAKSRREERLIESENTLSGMAEGHIDWPSAIKGVDHNGDRFRLQVALRSVSVSGADFKQSKEIIERLSRRVSAEIHDLDTQDYLEAKSFLRNLQDALYASPLASSERAIVSAPVTRPVLTGG